LAVQAGFSGRDHKRGVPASEGVGLGAWPVAATFGTVAISSRKRRFAMWNDVVVHRSKVFHYEK
jgi:hypothetical protein